MNDITSIQSGKAADTRMIVMITERITMLTELARKGRDVCASNADRLLGGRPEGPGDSPENIRAFSGNIGLLEDSINDLERALREAVDEVKRFERL